jgi:hypothetical protein
MELLGFHCGATTVCESVASTIFESGGDTMWPLRNRKKVHLLPGVYCCILFVLFLRNSRAEGQEKGTSSSTKDNRDQSVSVSHGSPVKLGGITVGGGYSYHSGHYGYPYYYGPFWGSYWGPGWYHPGWSVWGYPGFVFSGRTEFSGEIKIQTPEKSAEVFIDGAYAGIVEDLKNFWLEPGVYNLEIKTSADKFYQKRLYVLSGKTLKISPVFSPVRKEE